MNPEYNEEKKYREFQCKIGSTRLDINQINGMIKDMSSLSFGMKCHACGEFEFQQKICDNCMKKIQRDYREMKSLLSFEEYVETVILAYTLTKESK